jgi:hypothetical protein
VLCNQRATKGTSKIYGPEQHPTGDPNCPQGRAHPGCIAHYERYVKKQLAAAYEAVAERTLDTSVAAYQTRQAARIAEEARPPKARPKRPRKAPMSQLEGLMDTAGLAADPQLVSPLKSPAAKRSRRGVRPQQGSASAGAAPASNPSVASLSAADSPAARGATAEAAEQAQQRQTPETDGAAPLPAPQAGPRGKRSSRVATTGVEGQPPAAGASDMVSPSKPPLPKRSRGEAPAERQEGGPTDPSSAHRWDKLTTGQQKQRYKNCKDQRDKAQGEVEAALVKLAAVEAELTSLRSESKRLVEEWRRWDSLASVAAGMGAT